VNCRLSTAFQWSVVRCQSSVVSGQSPSQFTIHYSQFTIYNSLFSLSRFTLHPFQVHHSQFTIQPFSLHPSLFPIPHSLFKQHPRSFLPSFGRRTGRPPAQRSPRWSTLPTTGLAVDPFRSAPSETLR